MVIWSLLIPDGFFWDSEGGAGLFVAVLNSGLGRAENDGGQLSSGYIGTSAGNYVRGNICVHPQVTHMKCCKTLNQARTAKPSAKIEKF